MAELQLLTYFPSQSLPHLFDFCGTSWLIGVKNRERELSN